MNSTRINETNIETAVLELKREAGAYWLPSPEQERRSLVFFKTTAGEVRRILSDLCKVDTETIDAAITDYARVLFGVFDFTATPQQLDVMLGKTITIKQPELYFCANKAFYLGVVINYSIIHSFVEEYKRTAATPTSANVLNFLGKYAEAYRSGDYLAKHKILDVALFDGIIAPNGIEAIERANANTAITQGAADYICLLHFCVNSKEQDEPELIHVIDVLRKFAPPANVETQISELLKYRGKIIEETTQRVKEYDALLRKMAKAQELETLIDEQAEGEKKIKELQNQKQPKERANVPTNISNIGLYPRTLLEVFAERNIKPTSANDFEYGKITATPKTIGGVFIGLITIKNNLPGTADKVGDYVNYKIPNITDFCEICLGRKPNGEETRLIHSALLELSKYSILFGVGKDGIRYGNLITYNGTTDTNLKTFKDVVIGINKGVAAGHQYFISRDDLEQIRKKLSTAELAIFYEYVTKPEKDLEELRLKCFGYSKTADQIRRNKDLTETEKGERLKTLTRKIQKLKSHDKNVIKGAIGKIENILLLPPRDANDIFVIGENGREKIVFRTTQQHPVLLAENDDKKALNFGTN